MRKTGVVNGKNGGVLKRKEQTFYSLFDREIPDVLKSVLREEKKGIQSSEFVWNHRPNLIGIGVRINRNMQRVTRLFSIGC